MTLLADRLGYVQLAEPVRFTAAWERAGKLVTGSTGSPVDDRPRRWTVDGGRLATCISTIIHFSTAMLVHSL